MIIINKTITCPKCNNIITYSYVIGGDSVLIKCRACEKYTKFIITEELQDKFNKQGIFESFSKQIKESNIELQIIKAIREVVGDYARNKFAQQFLPDGTPIPRGDD